MFVCFVTSNYTLVPTLSGIVVDVKTKQKNNNNKNKFYKREKKFFLEITKTL